MITLRKLLRMVFQNAVEPSGWEEPVEQSTSPAYFEPAVGLFPYTLAYSGYMGNSVSLAPPYHH